MIELLFRLAAVAGTMVYLASILKFRETTPKTKHKKIQRRNRKEKPHVEPEKKFEPKLNIEDFPHV